MDTTNPNHQSDVATRESAQLLFEEAQHSSRIVEAPTLASNSTVSNTSQLAGEETPYSAKKENNEEDDTSFPSDTSVQFIKVSSSDNGLEEDDENKDAEIKETAVALLVASADGSDDRQPPPAPELAVDVEQPDDSAGLRVSTTPAVDKNSETSSGHSTDDDEPGGASNDNNKSDGASGKPTTAGFRETPCMYSSWSRRIRIPVVMTLLLAIAVGSLMGALLARGRNKSEDDVTASVDNTQPGAAAPPPTTNNQVAPTATPTMEPTAQPTTAAPTTANPTAAPTTLTTPAPTSSHAPTLAPTITPPPTAAPTSQTEKGAGLNAIRMALQELSLNPSALDDSTTPEARAAQFLFNATRSATAVEALLTDSDRLVQCYALLVLDISLTGNDDSAIGTHSGLAKDNALDECSWTGVTCNVIAKNNVTDSITAPETSMVVTRIVWPAEGLSGTIPKDIGLLKRVTHLDLGENLIRGSIPDELYNLVDLEYLYLHSNQLTGSISEDIANCFQLDHVFLGSNNLTGPFPKGLGSPSLGDSTDRVRRLSKLILNNNQITGPIPEGLNLRNLNYLDLGNNRMTGTIPSEWWKTDYGLKSIKTLHLDHNAFTGTFSSDFVDIGDGRLNQLSLAHNQFSGEFPGRWDPTKFLQALEIQNAGFDSIDKDLCYISVFVAGEMIALRSDCDICECGSPFCRPPVCTKR